MSIENYLLNSGSKIPKNRVKKKMALNTNGCFQHFQRPCSELEGFKKIFTPIQLQTENFETSNQDYKLD